MISVCLIGAGNVASHLFKAFINSKEVTVYQWYNRNLESISNYKNQVKITSNLQELQNADVYILAISDDAIKDISSKLPFSHSFVVHTSGGLTLHELDKKNSRGVFYPLQTFSKDREIDFSQVPICIETEHKKDLTILKSLAEAIGSDYYRVNGEQRNSFHLAAVFANNFSNQLYRIAHEICESKSADFKVLKPLILETAKKIYDLSPYQAQTGPAKRNDKKTIKKHLKMLEKNEHKEIYELLTKVIQQTHGKKL